MLREALYWSEQRFVGLMIPNPPSQTGNANSSRSLSLIEL